jgi:hypothetical protein
MAAHSLFSIVAKVKPRSPWSSANAHSADLRQRGNVTAAAGVEYSIRAAQIAVYQLLKVKRAIPAITPHDKALNTKLEALKRRSSDCRM